MFATITKAVFAGSLLSLALAATPASAAESVKAPLVMVDEAPAVDAGGGKVWFAFMWPENLKPQLEEKKMLLTICGLFFFGSIWGPIALLGQSFDMEWALPSIIFSVVAFIWPFFFIPFFGWVSWFFWHLGWNWIATQVMFANLNRPEISIGGGEAAVK